MKKIIRCLEQTAWAMFMGCICAGLLGGFMAILAGIAMAFGVRL